MHAAIQWDEVVEGENDIKEQKSSAIKTSYKVRLVVQNMFNVTWVMQQNYM